MNVFSNGYVRLRGQETVVYEGGVPHLEQAAQWSDKIKAHIQTQSQSQRGQHTEDESTFEMVSFVVWFDLWALPTYEIKRVQLWFLGQEQRVWEGQVQSVEANRLTGRVRLYI